MKVCPFDAITLESNLAYIDPNKCKSCRKCVEVCPQDTIIELNFPPRKPKVEGETPAATPKKVVAAAKEVPVKVVESSKAPEVSATETPKTEA